MNDRIVAVHPIADEVGRGLVTAGRICLPIGAALLAVLLVAVVREARAQVEGREHVLAGVGRMVTAATVAGLVMVAWLAGVLVEILTLAATAVVVVLVVVLAVLSRRRLAPYRRRIVAGPVVLRLLAGPIGRLLGVDKRARRLLIQARRRELAEWPP